MKKICCIGIVTVDVIAKTVRELPQPGKLSGIDSIAMYVGGCAANAATDLTKLGVGADLVIKTGKDGFSEFVRSYLSGNNVSMENIIEDPSLETGASIVTVNESGERSFLHNPGANDRLVSADISDRIISDNDIIFIAGTFLMEDFDGQECLKVLKRAKAAGKMTVLDTAWDFRGYWMKKLSFCFEYLDLFMPSYDEAVMLCGEEKNIDMIADSFFALGAKNVVIKCGSEGAYICEAGKERFMSPAFLCEKPADTTGAGDSFCAGFLAGIASGYDYRHSAELGNAVGNFCVSRVGASTGIKSLAETEKFIADKK